MSYQAKNEPQLSRQLKVQELAIPLVIVGNATAGSVAISCDEPSLLFVKTEGVNQTTAALASGETAPTYNADDSDGEFGVLLAVGEDVVKVVSAQLVSMTTEGFCSANFPSAPSSGITAGTGGGKKIALDCDCDVDLSGSNTFTGTLIVKYVTEQ